MCIYSNYDFCLFQLGAKQDERTLTYYIGGRDACTGDSGGPLYRFDKGKAYLVGVVSHVENGVCGKFNLPGTYTDVFKYRRWIKKNSRGGSCN